MVQDQGQRQGDLGTHRRLRTQRATRIPFNTCSQGRVTLPSSDCRDSSREKKEKLAKEMSRNFADEEAQMAHISNQRNSN